MIHWFELPANTHIGLKDECIHKLRKIRGDRDLSQKQIATLMKISEGGFRHWELKQRSPSVKFLLDWLRILNLSPLFIEKHIEKFYQDAGKSRIAITNPPFPLEETPEHAAIITHGFCDGSSMHPRAGGIIYQSYNLVEQKIFKKLIISSDFGDFRIPENSKGHVTFPAPLSKLLQYHYGINSFLSREGIFSKKIMSLCREHQSWRIAILRAAYVDEDRLGKLNHVITSKSWEVL